MKCRVQRISLRLLSEPLAAGSIVRGRLPTWISLTISPSLSLSLSLCRLGCVLYGCCLPLQFEIRFQSTIPRSIWRSEKWEAKSTNACRSYEISDGNRTKCTKLRLGILRGVGGLWVSDVQRNMIPSFFWIWSQYIYLKYGHLLMRIRCLTSQ